MAQLMPLPLTVYCFSKIQIGFTFLVPAHPGSPGKGAVKRVCVCVCVCEMEVNVTDNQSIPACTRKNASTVGWRTSTAWLSGILASDVRQTLRASHRSSSCSC